MFKVPNKHRVRTHPELGSTDAIGNNVAFEFKLDGYEVFCIASDGLGWNHVSVSINRKRTPGWDIMCKVKDMFWDDDDTILQYHPPKSMYVNFHPYVLHLWQPIGFSIPVPDPALLGPMGG